MSTAPTPTGPKAIQPAASREPAPYKEIRIVSHCTLFYWWPVWAVGFLMAIATWWTSANTRMVVVGATAQHFPVAQVNADGKTLDSVTAWAWEPRKGEKQHLDRLWISPSKNLGVLYSVILLIVIAITNVPLRGLWSLIVIVLIVAFAIIFALLDWWEKILAAIQILDIRMNFEGYLLISTILFVFWLVVFLFFDNQVYMSFSPGQLRVRQAVGDAETAYDTTGMTIQKQRSDLFRHYILGIGSGDLIVNTAGAQAHHFEMANVLFIGRKVNQIEEMLRSRQVVSND